MKESGPKKKTHRPTQSSVKCLQSERVLHSKTNFILHLGNPYICNKVIWAALKKNSPWTQRSTWDWKGKQKSPCL